MYDVCIEAVLSGNGRNRGVRLSACLKHLCLEFGTVLAPGRSLEHSIYRVRVIHVDTMPSAYPGFKVTWPAAYEQYAAEAIDLGQLKEPAPLTALAVDSAWLRHCHPPRRQGRHVNLVVGRACFEGGETRLYAYVHNQVPSAATRLDRFLTSSGVGHNERVTIFTDGGGEFEKAVSGASRPTCRILDWFHIAMKFRAIDLTASNHPNLLAPNGRNLCDEIASCK